MEADKVPMGCRQLSVGLPLLKAFLSRLRLRVEPSAGAGPAAPNHVSGWEFCLHMTRCSQVLLDMDLMGAPVPLAELYVAADL